MSVSVVVAEVIAVKGIRSGVGGGGIKILFLGGTSPAKPSRPPSRVYTTSPPLGVYLDILSR